MRRAALGIFGFPLVVLAAIGNMALAAVPVIYANVHFCAAVFTEKQAGQRVDFSVPVGAFDRCVFQNPLHIFKVDAVNNRFMHIFCDVPLASVYIVVSLIPEMLRSLEVDYIAAILLPRKNMGQRGFVPLVTVATVYKGNIIKNLIMDCQSYTKYRPNETTGGIFVSWRRKEELPTGA